MIQTGLAASNSGIVDLGDRMLIFDTTLSPASALDLRNAAESLTGRSVDCVFNSHFHNDHIFGNAVVESKTEVYATAQVWDVKTGKELFALTNHAASVFYVAFSKDGNYIATASADKTAKIWDAQTGQEVLTLNAPGPLSGVAFSPDGTQVALAGRDGTTRLYLLQIEDLIALAKSRLTRTLTPEECQRYLHGEACPTE